MDTGLKGKVALVTGSGSGITKPIAIGVDWDTYVRVKKEEAEQRKR